VNCVFVSAYNCMSSKPTVFFKSAEFLASFQDERLVELRKRAGLYLGKKLNRGQHERELVCALGESRETVLEFLRPYFASQEQKWSVFCPVIEKYLGYEPTRILDVGSSIGNASITLSYFYPIAKVLGFEIEPEAVELARLLAGGRSRCHFVNQSIESLRDEDGQFDFIHCANVLEHVENPEAVLRRLATSLTDGGVMLISGPNYLFPWEHHVHCWMLPGGPKSLVKWVLRLRGDQNAAFIDHLRFDVNTLSVKRWLRSCGNLEWRDLSHDKIDEVLTGDNHGLFAPKLVARIKALHLNGIAAKMSRCFPLTPSMTLLVKKRRACEKKECGS
jgi:2-polyprenyl-3-methyl-5-hydroxy-6-metoxy-1,4-benzoquinol methylase